MIGRGTYLDDALHLKLAAYARDGAQLRAQRGIRLDPEVIDFLRAADEIATSSAYVSPLRNSPPAVAESSPVDQLPAEITARQAGEILDRSAHWARHLAHVHGWITRGKPIMISRDAVLAYKLRRDERTAARPRRSPHPATRTNIKLSRS